MSAGRWTLSALVIIAAAPLAAQERAREEPRATLRGVVVDGLRGDPLPNAIVRLVDGRKGMLTDSLGRFEFAEVRLGADLLAVKQYGYGEVNVDVDVRPDHPLLRIELSPGPLALEGFTVIADRLAAMNQRFRSRRNATAASARPLGQERLARSSARDMLDFLQMEASLQLISCSSRMADGGAATSFRPVAVDPRYAMGACIMRRGHLAEPQVYIDESWAIGGLDQLAMYRPYEFYLVEVFSAGGEIRAYTHNFMERMARQPMTLFPIGLWFDR